MARSGDYPACAVLLEVIPHLWGEHAEDDRVLFYLYENKLLEITVVGPNSKTLEVFTAQGVLQSTTLLCSGNITKLYAMIFWLPCGANDQDYLLQT